MAFDTIGFHVTKSVLNPGSIIEPGNWGRIIKAIGPNHQHHAREMEFEDVRAGEFPDKQSRLTSCFVWPTLKDAKWYREHHHKTDFIYEIRFDQELPLHQGVFLLVNTPPNMTRRESIVHYWKFDHGVHWDQDPTYMPIEIVTASPLVVRDTINLCL